MDPRSRRLRVVTLNLWNDQGPAEARLSHTARQLDALQPDLVLLQEVRGGPPADQVGHLARGLDAQVVFDPVDVESAGGPIGNAVLSRFPVRARERARLPGPPGDPRGIVVAVLETPVGRLAVASTHFSWELDAAALREEQAIVADRVARSCPSDLPRILGGDFNCTPDSDVVRFLTGRASLGGRATFWRDAFARRHPHEDGLTWARKNPFVRTNVEPDRRIDYVFVGMPFEDGTGSILDARVVLDVPGEDGIFASDHFGVFVEIQLR